jgi:mutator protein MutT
LDAGGEGLFGQVGQLVFTWPMANASDSTVATSSNSPPPPTKIAVAVVEQDGRFLIGQRPEGAALAGLWEFPGGKLEPGETLEQAAVRECQEEAGIAVKVLGERMVVTQQYGHGMLELHFFACSPSSADQVPKQPFRWVHGAQLGDYAFPAANSTVVETLRHSAAE